VELDREAGGEHLAGAGWVGALRRRSCDSVRSRDSGRFWMGSLYREDGELGLGRLVDVRLNMGGRGPGSMQRQNF
jgi:hypothetical protein